MIPEKLKKVGKKGGVSAIVVFIIAVLLLVALSSCSARRFYAIRSSEPQKPQLQKYKAIHLGWLPIDENEWLEHDYSSKKEWVDVIRYLNVDCLQSGSKDYLPMKMITAATSADDNMIPKETELFIRFNSIKMEKYARTALIEVDFIDAKSNTVVYKVSSDISMKSSGFYLESTASLLMYNVASFLYYQLTD